MRRWVIGGASLVLAGVAAVFFGPGVYAAVLLAKPRAAPLIDPAPLLAAADQAEGKRKAILLGCLEGCHGKNGGGLTMTNPGVYVLTAPPLGPALQSYNDAEAVRLLRYGVKKHNRTAILMPAATFYPLSDEDILTVLAHLRTLTDDTAPKPSRRILRNGAIDLLTGQWRLSADEVDRARPRWGASARVTSFERGRYLASVVCAECHGADFEGVEFEGSPSLRIAAAYPDDAFKTLMRTGVPIGGRDLGIMSEVARDAFSQFTDEEIADIQGFLRTNFDNAAVDTAASR
jgi:cytochrome c553